MKEHNRLLAALSTADVEELPIEAIHATDELQMRRPDVLTEKDRKKDEQDRKKLIDDITRSLRDDPDFYSDPLKVVVCSPEDEEGFGVSSADELNCLVDGFHRFAAYSKAGRKTVRVQRVKGSWNEAQDVATIFNNHTRTVSVGAEQQRQQAWEMVNRHLDRESGVIKKPWSARRISDCAGVSHQTVNTMVKRAVALGKRAANLQWKEARSERQLREFSEFERTKHLVRTAMELIDKMQDERELDVVLRVLQDEADGKLVYGLDVDEYTARLMGDVGQEVEQF